MSDKAECPLRDIDYECVAGGGICHKEEGCEAYELIQSALASERERIVGKLEDEELSSEICRIVTGTARLKAPAKIIAAVKRRLEGE